MSIFRNFLSRKASGAESSEQVERTVVDIAPQEDMPLDTRPNMLSAKELRAQEAEKERKFAEVEAAAMAQAAEEEAKAAADILEKINASVGEEAAMPAAPVNIWDIEDDAPELTAAPEPAPSPRRRRNQTRVLGFDNPQGDVVSMFDTAEKATAAARAKFPVGWMLVVEGPGRGECFSLEAGMSQIGRGDDQAIKLDFGDNSISRVNHAAVVYDPETHSFMLGHGGKKNIVRLNGAPVISNETLTTGDRIRLGETTLHFVALCTAEFNWSDGSNPEESEDVAIA
jgi:hypothetical protein